MQDPKVTPMQIKKIHTLVSKLGIPDDRYRLILSDYWVNTSKNLTFREADDLIRRLEKIAIAKGVWSRYSERAKMRYEDMEREPGMASPKQLRMIEAMWKDVSYLRDQDKRSVALRHFVQRITGKSSMKELTSIDARKVIKAMQTMEKNKEVKNYEIEGYDVVCGV